MPQLMKSIALSALVLAAPFFAQADAIHGFIARRAGATYLVQNDGASVPFSITGSTPQIQANLDALKPGDYVVARGTLNRTAASIDAIESLGLQSLLGQWTDGRTAVYEFKDFSQLNLYLPNANSGQVVQAGSFQYSIAPDQGTRYQIFLSNAQAVTLGSLQLAKNQIVINLIDPKTGQVSPDIVLSPLNAAP